MLLLDAPFILATILQAPSPAQQPSPDVLPQARAILTAIAAGDFTQVEKQFTDNMKTAMPPGALAAMWAKLLNQAVHTGAAAPIHESGGSTTSKWSSRLVRSSGRL